VVNCRRPDCQCRRLAAAQLAVAARWACRCISGAHQYLAVFLKVSRSLMYCLATTASCGGQGGGMERVPAALRAQAGVRAGRSHTTPERGASYLPPAPRLLHRLLLDAAGCAPQAAACERRGQAPAGRPAAARTAALAMTAGPSSASARGSTGPSGSAAARAAGHGLVGRGAAGGRTREGRDGPGGGLLGPAAADGGGALTSRQMAPLWLLTLGCHTRVVNLILGGTKGYWSSS